MIRWLTIVSCCALVPIPAALATTVTHGWDDGSTTVLGFAGTPVNEGETPILASIDAVVVHAGNGSLKLVDNASTGSPQAFVAFVYGLHNGDQVSVTIFRRDTTPSGDPSCRLWGHWNDTLGTIYHDPNADNGSAGGNYDYGSGTGWEAVSHTWTVADGHTGLVVEIRTYSNPGDTVWVDDLSVTSPSTAIVQLPGMEPVVADPSTWGNVKALFR